MESYKEAEADPQRTYEDFEPFCKWHGRREKVEVHVQGFKKEHLSVQTNKQKGIVIIHGERPLTLKESDSTTTTTSRWSRFHKEIKLAETCDINEVRAKLAGAVLTVTMPDHHHKVSITTNSNIGTTPNPNTAATRTITQKDKDVDVPAAAADHDQHLTFKADDEQQKPAAATTKSISSTNNIATSASTFQVGKDDIATSASTFQVGKDVALVIKLVVAVSVGVAFGFGAYLVKYYKHGQPY